MNECERYETMLSAYLDGELPEAEEAELKAHLANCPDCAAMYEAFSAVGEAVRTQDVPDTLHSRIMETVRAAEKASRTQRAIIRLRPIFAAAAFLLANPDLCNKCKDEREEMFEQPDEDYITIDSSIMPLCRKMDNAYNNLNE